MMEDVGVNAAKHYRLIEIILEPTLAKQWPRVLN